MSHTTMTDRQLDLHAGGGYALWRGYRDRLQLLRAQLKTLEQSESPPADEIAAVRDELERTDADARDQLGRAASLLF
ncbi:MAG: hypothetical protein ACK5Q5_05330 [Planctomycetaceae bacterium]